MKRLLAGAQHQQCDKNKILSGPANITGVHWHAWVMLRPAHMTLVVLRRGISRISGLACEMISLGVAFS
jgi:hypothetical protein